MNLLDLAAIAVPAGIQADGLPFGVTLAAPAGSDARYALSPMRCTGRRISSSGRLNQTLPESRPAKVGGNEVVVQLAVCGAHMTGLPLNHQLTDRGGRSAASLPHRGAATACLRCPAARPRVPAWCASTHGHDDRGGGLGSADRQLRRLRRGVFPRRSASARSNWRTASRSRASCARLMPRRVLATSPSLAAGAAISTTQETG